MGDNHTIVLLVTRQTRQRGTQTLTEYSGIFAVNRNGLDEVEKEVFDMIRAHPDCWTCGSVTGYPESLFTDSERKAFRLHGTNKRFSM